MKECGIHLDIVFVANQQATKVAQPGESSLHLPSLAVTPQLSSILRFGFFAAGTMRTDQLNPPLFQAISQGIGVGGLVVNQPRRLVAWPSASLSRNGNRLERL